VTVAGRLRQILHLLRGALHTRRRSVAAGRKKSSTTCETRRQRRARNHPDRQNVNAYHGEDEWRSWPLGALLARLADIPASFACVTRPASRDVDDSLIARIATCRR